MYYEEESGAGNFMLGMLVGAVLGAGIALLTTPQTGKSMRTRLVRVGRSGNDAEDGTGGGDMDRAEIMRRLKRHRRRARH